MAESFRQYRYLVASDIYRVTGTTAWTAVLKQLFWGESIKYIVSMRTCRYLAQSRLTKYTLFPFARLLLRHYSHQLGISIPYRTRIGRGFYIGHFGGVVVSDDAQIGNNCNLSQGVTIGRTNRGKRKGAPIIGDSVYIGPGAVVIGAVKIGDHVAIGANAVVTDDLQDHAVAVGIPARVISDKGSSDYINRIDYPTPD
jgi:serine O-acetyltransferase